MSTEEEAEAQAAEGQAANAPAEVPTAESWVEGQGVPRIFAQQLAAAFGMSFTPKPPSRDEVMAAIDSRDILVRALVAAPSVKADDHSTLEAVANAPPLVQKIADLLWAAVLQRMVDRLAPSMTIQPKSNEAASAFVRAIATAVMGVGLGRYIAGDPVSDPPALASSYREEANEVRAALELASASEEVMAEIVQMASATAEGDYAKPDDSKLLEAMLAYAEAKKEAQAEPLAAARRSIVHHTRASFVANHEELVAVGLAEDTQQEEDIPPPPPPLPQEDISSPAPASAPVVTPVPDLAASPAPVVAPSPTAPAPVALPATPAPTPAPTPATPAAPAPTPAAPAAAGISGLAGEVAEKAATKPAPAAPAPVSPPVAPAAPAVLSEADMAQRDAERAAQRALAEQQQLDRERELKERQDQFGTPRSRLGSLSQRAADGARKLVTSFVPTPVNISSARTYKDYSHVSTSSRMPTSIYTGTERSRSPFKDVAPVLMGGGNATFFIGSAAKQATGTTPAGPPRSADKGPFIRL